VNERGVGGGGMRPRRSSDLDGVHPLLLGSARALYSVNERGKLYLVDPVTCVLVLLVQLGSIFSARR
jgi:hypothetical protein